MKKLSCLLFLLLLFVKPCFAAGTQTVNGIPLEDVDYTTVSGIRALHFTSHVFGAITAVYNESGSSTSTSGMVDVSKYPLKTVAVRVETVVGDGTLTVHINEFVGTTTFPSVGVTLNLGTGTTVVPIQEYCEHISIDAASTTGTITADIIGLYVKVK
jgi:hypothetical protein